MLIIESVLLLRQHIRRLRQEGKRIALVPTMGNLHDGHMKLVDEAKASADVVVVSIFVNPMQFDRVDDLARYPRTLQDDCEKLNKRHVDFVFAPTPAEVYPQGTEGQTYVDVPGLSTMLEGASRPGHFRGVFDRVDDLARYPRTLQDDCEKLNKTSCRLCLRADAGGSVPPGY